MLDKSWAAKARRLSSPSSLFTTGITFPCALMTYFVVLFGGWTDGMETARFGVVVALPVVFNITGRCCSIFIFASRFEIEGRPWPTLVRERGRGGTGCRRFNCRRSQINQSCVVQTAVIIAFGWLQDIPCSSFPHPAFAEMYSASPAVDVFP